MGERRDSEGKLDQIRRILAGERLVRDQYPRVYRFLYHLTTAHQHAEDLAQQTFLKAWQALATYCGESSLATWLHRIAYHEYTHRLRSRREHAPLEAAHEIAITGPDATLDAILLRRALSELTEEHQEAFLLYHVQGLSVAEVAAVLEIAEGTVQSRLFHARRQLRSILQKPFASRVACVND